MAVGEGDFHDAGAGAECGQRLRRVEQVDKRRPMVRSVAVNGGDDDAVSLLRRKRPADPVAQDGSVFAKSFLRALDRIAGVLQRLTEAFGGDVGNGVERQHHGVEGLAALVEQPARRRRRKSSPERQ